MDTFLIRYKKFLKSNRKICNLKILHNKSFPDFIKMYPKSILLIFFNTELFSVLRIELDSRKNFFLLLFIYWKLK